MRHLTFSAFTLYCLTVTACSTGQKTLVAVTPDSEGMTGVIAVYPTKGGSGPTLLDKPYTAATVESTGDTTPSTLDSEQVRLHFGQALAAMPSRPSRFILYFRGDSEQLSSESLAVIDTIKTVITKHAAPEVVLIGHTDTVAEDSYNDQLSLQRARRVKEELIRLGIAAKKISVSGRGKRELLVPTADNVSEPRNRRVEIYVR